ncbi:MAG: serine hydrolase, partial [Rhizobiales bacterium]|nr:serine hydrolase [Hyphomicrobiales bacterium]
MLHKAHVAKAHVAAALALAVLGAAPAAADERLLHEAIELQAVALYFSTGVPALVLGVVKDGEIAIVGFGETSEGSGKEPDGDTMMRIGSITKVFTGTT